MHRTLGYVITLVFACGIFAATQASAAPGGRSNIQGASYLTSHNNQTSNFSAVSANSNGIGSNTFHAMEVPAPSSLLLFSSALALVGFGRFGRGAFRCRRS